MEEALFKKIHHYSPMQIILMGYCIIILLGTVLLRLPAATRDGVSAPWLTCFFTATSASCVTGLILVDTYSHWSLFGQVVLLCLIQIGGIGLMTLCISAISFTKKKIGLASRALMQSAISAPQLGGIVRMTKFILLGTILLEGSGAILLAFYFCPIYGLGEGIWFSVFHSISAFCNAGFDLMGVETAFSSFTTEMGNWYINLVLMLLIVVGGLGFFVWRDILETKLRFSHMHLHTKLVLFVSGILTFGGALLLFYFSGQGAEFSHMPVEQRTLAALFQSVSARTAGFNTIDLSIFPESGLFFMICLMMIGGSPGSTAGGIKTTTLSILFLSILTTFWHKKSVEVFGRRMEEGITRTASCVFMMYLTAVCFGAMLIAYWEQIPFISSLFECVSAIATVGLSTGITATLDVGSQLILIFLMIFGRAGSMTMLLAFSSGKVPAPSALPLEKVQVG